MVQKPNPEESGKVEDGSSPRKVRGRLLETITTAFEELGMQVGKPEDIPVIFESVERWKKRLPSESVTIYLPRIMSASPHLLLKAQIDVNDIDARIRNLYSNDDDFDHATYSFNLLFQHLAFYLTEGHPEEIPQCVEKLQHILKGDLTIIRAGSEVSSSVVLFNDRRAVVESIPNKMDIDPAQSDILFDYNRLLKAVGESVHFLNAATQRKIVLQVLSGNDAQDRAGILKERFEIYLEEARELVKCDELPIPLYYRTDPEDSPLYKLLKDVREGRIILV